MALKARGGGGGGGGSFNQPSEGPVFQPSWRHFQAGFEVPVPPHPPTPPPPPPRQAVVVVQDVPGSRAPSRAELTVNSIERRPTVAIQESPPPPAPGRPAVNSQAHAGQGSVSSNRRQPFGRRIQGCQMDQSDTQDSLKRKRCCIKSPTRASVDLQALNPRSHYPGLGPTERL